jgi:UDP-N-acetyl-alpha-D-quinovosamine dehydrogenase
VNKILVSGAAGFVGRKLCRCLLDRGEAVVGAVRTKTDVPLFANDLFSQVEVGNIGPDTKWSAVLNGVGLVCHLAARVHVMDDTADDPLLEFRMANTLATENLARAAAAAGVRRFVYVSTIKVNGEGTQNGRKFAPSDVPAPQDAYAISKWEGERILHGIAAETGMEVVIVRPPLVYGPGVKGNFALMLSVVKHGIPLPLASAANLRSLIYVGNLVDALITCATHPMAAGQTYLPSDGEDISTSDLLRRLADAMGVPSRLFSCPPALLRMVGGLAGKAQQLERLLGSLQVDSAKIRCDLNWVPPYTLQQGLRATAEWYRNQQNT